MWLAMLHGHTKDPAKPFKTQHLKLEHACRRKEVILFSLSMRTEGTGYHFVPWRTKACGAGKQGGQAG
ncbi:hypothetical protein EYC80_004561 [Monilinia laxa]|uniref:Uncharacterized protein n=1 Tax=Monilinia laxa TaxID=61186 RepID=A0A5N6KH50_MONLA|nr:hypothetical protein EYC80_004561 [Monilinia laxa]